MAVAITTAFATASCSRSATAAAASSVSAAGSSATGEPKYLNSPETAVFHKGQELYGLYEAKQADRKLTRLLVVEGYMDVVSLARHGIHDVVATLGTATTADHVRRLFRVVPEIVFCFDGDRAGRAAAWRALQASLPEVREGRQIRFLFLPGRRGPRFAGRQGRGGRFPGAHGGTACRCPTICSTNYTGRQARSHWTVGPGWPNWRARC